MKTSYRLTRFCALAFCLLILPDVVQAQFTFTTNADNTITITSYNGSNGVVIIPGTTNGYPVTAIAVDAFVYNSNLTNVTIPDSVTSIGAAAFDGCINLASIAIPDEVTNIGDGAFNSCNGLTNVVIPASVTFIGNYVFFFCTNLSAIVVDAANPNYRSVDGVLFSKDETTLMQFPYAKAGSYTIPGSVTNIADEAFGINDFGNAGLFQALSGSPGLTNLVIPGSVANIGLEAFAYCANLTSVTLSDGITSIGTEAFYYSGLTRVTIPGSVTNVGAGAFAVCSRLATVTLQNGVTSIGEAGFNFCTNLTCVSLPDSLTSIGERAFWFCTGLTNVTIPANVTNIGRYAFSACASLQSITVNPNNPSYSSTDGVLYNGDRTSLLQFPGGKSGSFTIPEGVVCIADNALGSYEPIDYSNFYLASGGALTDIIFPSGINHLGDQPYTQLTDLTGIYFKGNAPADPGNLPYDIYIASTTVYRLPGTTGWDAAFDSVPIMLWSLPNPLILTFEPDFGVQPNNFGFTISWATNLPVVVDASTDLVHWQPVQTNALTCGSAYFSDSQWTNYASRFYRLHSLQ